ncbi:hypothetical protein CYMTET_10493 [Cymbomonas tetramitiformis]|uniref:Uncharacterized protein n=1 Tax=Cymbomonas tetramitiformis TaxID=36881 RepID=A0AAE0GP58_9CHLO|nr:hypothetical protein CYMTET_10493 [Cymbomonas tetramitiformis]
MTTERAGDGAKKVVGDGEEKLRNGAKEVGDNAEQGEDVRWRKGVDGGGRCRGGDMGDGDEGGWDIARRNGERCRGGMGDGTEGVGDDVEEVGYGAEEVRDGAEEVRDVTVEIGDGAEEAGDSTEESVVKKSLDLRTAALNRLWLVSNLTLHNLNRAT